MWDAAIAAFLAGGSAFPTSLQGWCSSYTGGRTPQGAVRLAAFPEPFLGPLVRPAAVFLALNPGQADLAFQGRDGIFAEEIHERGSYSAWAASWPYLRDPWVKEKGPNRHHSSRLRFMRDWVEDTNLQPSSMVGFELYPWHSTRVTGPLRPDRKYIEGFVWGPVAELGAPVFAFGAPWFPILQHTLGLRVIDRLGLGGRDYGSKVASRTVLVLTNDKGVIVVAEKHAGAAGPPSQKETERLKEALDLRLK